MNIKHFSLLAFSVSACFANKPGQVITIENNTSNPLGLNLTVPEYTAAVIQYTKIKSAQEMLHQAILDNSAEGIKKAVLAGADVNLGKDGKAPLLWAVLLKRHDAIDVLLSCKANANISYLGRPLMQYACEQGDMKLVLSLLKAGAAFYQGIMHYAVNHDSKELTHAIINQGYNLCDMPFGIWSQLLTHRKELLTFFLSNGANPNQILDNGMTPMIIAVQHNCMESITILLSAGANPNLEALAPIGNNEHHTPFSYAAVCGKSEIIELLLAHGATL